MTRWEGEVFGRESEVAFTSLFEWCENILSENNCRWPLNCLNPSYSLLVPTVLTGESARFPTSVFTHFFFTVHLLRTYLWLILQVKLWRVTRMIFCQKSFLWCTAVVSHLTTAQLNESLLMYETISRSVIYPVTIILDRFVGKIRQRCKLVILLQDFSQLTSTRLDGRVV